jgi:hypothetical protein
VWDLRYYVKLPRLRLKSNVDPFTLSRVIEPVPFCCSFEECKATTDGPRSSRGCASQRASEPSPPGPPVVARSVCHIQTFQNNLLSHLNIIFCGYSAIISIFDHSPSSKIKGSNRRLGNNFTFKNL